MGTKVSGDLCGGAKTGSSAAGIVMARRAVNAASETIYLEVEKSMEDITLDVRTLPHARRHQAIFEILERLEVGQALTIANDHDPAPLGYQLRALHGDKYGWEYVESGPEVWRVAIQRKA